MSVAKTLDTQLNVFAEFHPKLPPSAVSVPYLFLANIHPSLQWNVLDQVRSPRLVVLDTMNLWIRNNLEEVKRLLRRVDGIIINDQEVRMLTGETNLIRAGRAVLALGPRMVVLKKGEHGALVFHGDEVVPLPAFPLTNVVDPTGAGDSFAGGFMGYLASRGHRLTTGLLRRAVAHGVITSSFCCEDFSLERLKTVTKGEFGARYEAYRRLLRV
jgi:fructose-1-phosphate kinase PfkB-like protein